jgi:hypothetical protein
MTREDFVNNIIKQIPLVIEEGESVLDEDWLDGFKEGLYLCYDMEANKTCESCNVFDGVWKEGYCHLIEHPTDKDFFCSYWESKE